MSLDELVLTSYTSYSLLTPCQSTNYIFMTTNYSCLFLSLFRIFHLIFMNYPLPFTFYLKLEIYFCGNFIYLFLGGFAMCPLLINPPLDSLGWLLFIGPPLFLYPLLYFLSPISILFFYLFITLALVPTFCSFVHS